MRTEPIVTLLIPTLVLLSHVSAGQLSPERSLVGRVALHGTASITVGHADNPTGSTYLDAVDYGVASLQTAVIYRNGPSSWKLGYVGRITSVSDDTQLGSMRHALGAEWRHGRGPGHGGASAGLQVARRSNDERYAAYDRTEVQIYAVKKIQLRPTLMWRTVGGLDVMRYGDLPEESSLEPYGRSELRLSLPTRSTVGLTMRYGAKIYDDPAAAGVWATNGSPSTSEASLGLTASQSLSDRLGLRASFDYDWSLSDFPRWAQDDMFDNPLLDGYASEDATLESTLRILGPAQIWVEIGGGVSERDYGSLLFAVVEGGAERTDDITWASLSLKRRLRIGPGDATFRARGSWIDQSSSLALYSWTGVSASTSLSWSW